VPASLKRASFSVGGQCTELFPALISAGLIEAIRTDTPQGRTLRFPALISAGLIEAAAMSTACCFVSKFPALISAGLIEAAITVGPVGTKGKHFRH